MPLESEFVKWRDDVVVPCGKPVPASIKTSELMYNEYIVYNTSQVQTRCSFALAAHWKSLRIVHETFSLAGEDAVLVEGEVPPQEVTGKLGEYTQSKHLFWY